MVGTFAPLLESPMHAKFAFPSSPVLNPVWTSAPPVGVPLPGPMTQSTFTGTSGNDNFTGTADPDVFFLGQGGRDRAAGAGGNDQFFLDTAFAANDQVDGGLGTDTLTLEGDYSAGVVFTATTVTNMEIVQLAGNFTFNLTLHEDTVGAGQTMQVGGGPAQVIVDASADTDAALIRLIGWTGQDTLIGSAGVNILQGRGNADFMAGGGGDDTFFYNSVSESTSFHFDTIDGFVFKNGDLFDMPVTVSTIDEKVAAGSLSDASFDGDLMAAIGADQLAAGHAVVFRPDGGTYDGATFLIIDANATAGYQGNQDYVILLEDPVKLAKLNAADFI